MWPRRRRWLRVVVVVLVLLVLVLVLVLVLLVLMHGWVQSRRGHERRRVRACKTTGKTTARGVYESVRASIPF
jgi:uncharacterized membrane protein affecting hemolysin expression